MKSIRKSLISIVAVAATAVLLLAGCRLGNHGKDKVPAVEQTQATVDTTEEDTMAAFYERIQFNRDGIFCLSQTNNLR